MKKITIFMATLLLLLSLALSAQAADNDFKGDFTGLLGNESLWETNYQLTDKLKLEINNELTDNVTAYSGQKDYLFRTGVHYQALDWLGVRAGGLYDFQQGQTVPYLGFNFYAPFCGSNNIKCTGYYNYDYEGKDWENYEFAWRIQAFEHIYIDAGVRGDAGNDFVPYSYNPENDPVLFIRGDYTTQWRKFELHFLPFLTATGFFMADVNLKYNLSSRVDLIMDVSDLYDYLYKYRAGFEYKF